MNPPSSSHAGGTPSNQELRNDLEEYKKRAWCTVRLLVVIALLVSCGLPLCICGSLLLLVVTDPPVHGTGKILLPLGSALLILGTILGCACRKKMATKRQYQEIFARRGLDADPPSRRAFSSNFQLPDIEEDQEAPHSSSFHRPRSLRAEEQMRKTGGRSRRFHGEELTPPPPYSEVIESF